jgi:hypothetical protein
VATKRSGLTRDIIGSYCGCMNYSETDRDRASRGPAVRGCDSRPVNIVLNTVSEGTLPTFGIAAKLRSV